MARTVRFSISWRVAVTALLASSLPLTSSAQELEAGLLDVTQATAGDWHSIHFDQTFTAPPVVVLGPLSSYQIHGATLRTRNVTTTGFEFQIDEWDYLDGAHPPEQLSFLALEEGSHTIDGVQWQALRISATNRIATTTAFPIPFVTAPIVITQIEGTANAGSLTSRVQNVTPTGFDTLVQSEEATAATTLADESIAAIAIQPGNGNIGDLSFQAAVAPSLAIRGWRTTSFPQPSPNPVLLAAMQTVNDPDPAILRMRALTLDGVDFRADEERSADTELSHPGESVGYLAISGQIVQGTETDAKIEFGDVTTRKSNVLDWQPVTFAQTYLRPVVVTGPLSYNNAHPAGVRLRNITSTGFEFKIEEWDYLAPGNHPEETFAYLVMEDGLYEIDGIRIEAARAEQTATTNATRTFTQAFRNQPILLPQLATDIAPEAAAARTTAVTPLNFRLRIAEEEFADNLHPAEQVHYLAIEAGTGTFSNGSLFSAVPATRRLGGGWRDFDLGGNFLTPFVFAATQTEREFDPFHLRLRNLTGFRVNLRINEERSLDNEVSHRAEELGFLAIQGGVDTDADGLPDDWETANNLDPNDPTDATLDQDSDGLTALEEFAHSADPHRADTDGDGLLDAYEANAGTLANRNARAPFKPKPRTGLTVFTPEPRPFDPAP